MASRLHLVNILSFRAVSPADCLNEVPFPGGADLGGDTEGVAARRTPTPDIPHPIYAPYTLHLTPHTLYMRPSPYTTHPTPYASNLQTKPETLNQAEQMWEEILNGSRRVRQALERKIGFFFFFFTLGTGPRRSLSLKLGDTRVYESQTRKPKAGTTPRTARTIRAADTRKLGPRRA